MTTKIRVFTVGYECPNATYTCKSCCTKNATNFAVRPISQCDECQGEYEEFNSLPAAMIAYPSIPWYDLPVVAGEEPEPELVAAVNAHLATIVIGPP